MDREKPGAQCQQGWNPVFVAGGVGTELDAQGEKMERLERSLLEGHQCPAKEFKFLVSAEPPTPTHPGHGRLVPRSHRFTFRSHVHYRRVTTGQVSKLGVGCPPKHQSLEALMKGMAGDS